MDWDDLRFFLAVASAGSVRGGASRLNVSHSTVSRRLDGFEKALGVRLFDRHNSGYRLTPAGEDILELSHDVRSSVDEIERRIMGQDASLRGEIRLTAPDHVACGLLLPDIATFNDAYPDIDIELIVSFAPADLDRREADVALRITSNPPEHLVGRRVGRYANAIYASPAYLADHPLDDRSGLRWIGWNEHNPFPDWVRDSAFPDVPTRGRYPNPMVQMSAARAGLGLAMLPCFMADPDPALVRVVPELAAPQHDVWLLTHPDLRETSRIRVFMRHIADAFAARSQLLAGATSTAG